MFLCKPGTLWSYGIPTPFTHEMQLFFYGKPLLLRVWLVVALWYRLLPEHRFPVLVGAYLLFLSLGPCRRARHGAQPLWTEWVSTRCLRSCSRLCSVIRAIRACAADCEHHVAARPKAGDFAVLAFRYV